MEKSTQLTYAEERLTNLGVYGKKNTTVSGLEKAVQDAMDGKKGIVTVQYGKYAMEYHLSQKPNDKQKVDFTEIKAMSDKQTIYFKSPQLETINTVIAALNGRAFKPYKSEEFVRYENGEVAQRIPEKDANIKVGQYIYCQTPAQKGSNNFTSTQITEQDKIDFQKGKQPERKPGECTVLSKDSDVEKSVALGQSPDTFKLNFSLKDNRIFMNYSDPEKRNQQSQENKEDISQKSKVDVSAALNKAATDCNEPVQKKNNRKTSLS